MDEVKVGNIVKKKIIFTGGGTAGHVTVNLALIPKFTEEDWQVLYIGSENGIEKQLISPLDKVRYKSIATGKLRRYFDWNNFKDPFRVVKGMFQAYKIIKNEKPNVLFSKGGFVAVPVVIGAWLNKVPVITHESDLTPGLANKITLPFVTKVCTTFPETKQFLPKDKAVHIGAIVREELMQGSKEQGLKICRFTNEKPVLLVIGGSLGARKINEIVRANLESLTVTFQIVHICGKGNVVPELESVAYRQFEYVQQDLAHLFAMTDIVISRSGSNAIFEFLALQKPMLLIPLSKAASRGDQILNARSFERAGYAKVIEEEDLTNEKLLDTVHHLFSERTVYIEKMRAKAEKRPIDKVVSLIKDISR